MPLAAGTRLGPYELLGAIGAGGMGEVCRARDPRLGRDVAIKVLPETIAADPDRVRRFSQEARAVAALNHPDILTVHDVGVADGTSHVVTSAHSIPGGACAASCEQALSRGLCLVGISPSSAESVPGTPRVFVHKGGARWSRTGGLLLSPPLLRFP